AALAVLLLVGSRVSAQEQSDGSQGIQVHGHWSVVVSNPDGSVVSRNEFENKLFGADFLGQVLARAATPGVWGVVTFASQNGVSPCGGNCVITEPTVGGNTSNNLTVNWAANPSRVVLQGSFQASQAGEIVGVASNFA